MAAVAMIYGLIAEGSVWFPVNLLAAGALPELAAADLPGLRAFNGTALLVATLLHGLLSLLVGLVYAALLPMLPGSHTPHLYGGLVAPALWSGLVWASLGAVDPALGEYIQWGWFIASQVVFGLVTGVLIARVKFVETPQYGPVAEREELSARESGIGGNRP
jgi:hypothetical protein